MNPEQQYYEVAEFWSPEQETEMDLARYRHVADVIPARTKSVLDVGCGNGSLLRYLRTTSPGLHLHGFDRSAAALRHVNEPHTSGDITQLPFTEGQFDCLTCCEVLEHLPAPLFNRALTELARVAKHTVIVTVPAAENLAENQIECPDCRSRFNANLHLRSFSIASMANMMIPHGFSAIVTPMLAAPVYPGLAALLRLKKGRPARVNYFPHSIPCAICGTDIPPSQPQSAGAPKTLAITTKPRVTDRLLRRCWPHYNKPRWFIAQYQRITS
jgi:SAM-dependent methyltransferase